MDQSDERECNVIQYPESRNYESSLPPILRTDDGKISPVMVNVSVNLLNIADIKVYNLNQVRGGLATRIPGLQIP